MFWVFTALILGFLAFIPGIVEASQPEHWQLGFQEAASPVMERITGFHNFMLWIIGFISVFVLILLVIVVLRFNKRANPTPSTTSHNTMLEVVWTMVPVLILVVVSVYSLPLLYYTDRVENPDMTLKITGYQWYWGYEYPDNGDISFDSYMIPDNEIDTTKGQTRLLSTDNPVVLPIDTNIQLLMTAADVIHAFAVPAFGIKLDAVPGRLNETWVRIDEPGTYYGQCSEICGKDHSYMPIEIKAVSKDDFNKWAANQNK